MKSQKFSNLIQLSAESIGIKTLDNEIVDYLNTEIEEKIKMALYSAKKFMRVSKRKTLKVDDLNHALKFYNFNPLIGYDSYANSEYEKNETVKGLWRQKQNIIDLEEYLSKPISSYPMKPFPHFHWFAIEGKRPNISENFIREEIKEQNVDSSIKSKEKKSIDEIKPKENIVQNTNATKVNNIPVIHNISKELQIFFDNFIQRFRKEIKINKLNTSSQFLSITKELEVSIDVVRNSPGVVELLPYIIEFLMKVLIECPDPKIYITVIYFINAILCNQCFFIEPYLQQIITLLLSLILIDIDSLEFLDNILKVKVISIKILKTIIDDYKVKYPNLVYQMKSVFEDNIFSKNYLTSFGAIESLIMLGPIFTKQAWTKEKEEKMKKYLNKITYSDEKEKNEIFINDTIDCKINIDNDLNHKNDKITNIDDFYKNDIIKRKQMCVWYAINNLIKIINDFDKQFNI